MRKRHGSATVICERNEGYGPHNMMEILTTINDSLSLMLSKLQQEWECSMERRYAMF